MPRHKTKQTRSTSNRAKKTTTKRTRVKQATVPFEVTKGRLSQLKWGESYTSLLLGIVVVIVAVLFGVSIFRQSKHLQQTTSLSTSPAAVVTATPTPESNPKTVNGQKMYTVQAGDDLWSISEKFYNSGYNWIDIAKANNLTSPSQIFSGNELIIPSVTPIIAQVSPSPTITKQQPNAATEQAITSNTYTVQKGDDLWNIAVRAYGNGYRWSDIAKANNLTNPSLIFSGNVLTIPR